MVAAARKSPAKSRKRKLKWLFSAELTPQRFVQCLPIGDINAQKHDLTVDARAARANSGSGVRGSNHVQ